MSDINELIASNDPMATPIMGIDGSPANDVMPVPTHASTPHEQRQAPGEYDNFAMSDIRRYNVSDTRSRHSAALSALYTEHRDSATVAACAAVVLLPFVQDLLKKHVPMYDQQPLVRIAATAALIGLAHLILKDYVKASF